MTEIFIDGLRSIAVANGVVRIELVQLRRGESKSNLESEVVGTLMLPAGALKSVTGQLASTLKKLEEASAGDAKGQGKTGSGGEDFDSALQNL